MTTPATLYNRSLLDDDDDESDDDAGERPVSAALKSRRSRRRGPTKTKSIRNVYKNKGRPKSARQLSGSSKTSTQSESTTESETGYDDEDDEQDDDAVPFLLYCLKNHQSRSSRTV